MSEQLGFGLDIEGRPQENTWLEPPEPPGPRGLNAACMPRSGGDLIQLNRVVGKIEVGESGGNCGYYQTLFVLRDLTDVREVFDLFDFWDGRDGLIGAEKVGDLLRCLGLNPTLSIVKKFGGTDKPGEKQFSFEEFLPIVKDIIKIEDTGTYAEFCEAFKSFDREGMGYITAGEMNYMLTAMGERLSDAETDAIMTDTDTQPDIDGNLKYEDFIKKVLKGHNWSK